MIKTFKPFFNLFTLLAILSSCLNESNDQKNIDKVLNIDTSTGKYHFLEDNGTKIYLPSDFERISLTKYQRLLDSLSTKKEYKFC